MSLSPKRIRHREGVKFLCEDLKVSFLKSLTSLSRVAKLLGSAKKTARSSSSSKRNKNPIKRVSSNAEYYIYKLEIIHPETKNPFEPPVNIWLTAPESKVFRKAYKEFQRRKEVAQSSFLTNLQLEIRTNDNIGSFLARCTIDWENIEWHEETLEFNYKNAKMVFKKIHWFRDQVIEYYKIITNR